MVALRRGSQQIEERMKYLKLLALFGLAVATFACHGREGTRPADMSAEEHDTAAAAAEAKSVEAEAEYEGALLIFDSGDCSEFCFPSNPNEEHLREATRLRREAKRHRDASHELRVAEERAYADIPEIHRDFSPFYHRGHITGVEIGDGGPTLERPSPLRSRN